MFENNQFTHVLMNFGPNIFTDPNGMGEETLRILTEGGKAGFTCWTKVGWLESMQGAFGSSFVAPPRTQWAIGDARLAFDTWEFKESSDTTWKFTDVDMKESDFTTIFNDANIFHFVRAMEDVIPELQTEDGRRKYFNYLLKELEDKGEIRMIWKALIITAKKGKKQEQTGGEE